MIKINCDLCGKVDERFNRALIEEVELNVCSNCSKFGKIIGQVNKPRIREYKRAEEVEDKEEKIELLVDNYPDIIKKRRESMGLSQKDFAKKINEKESAIHHIETGSFEPPLALARKLEKALGVKIIEEYLEDKVIFKKKKDEGFTLGDFINIKK